MVRWWYICGLSVNILLTDYYKFINLNNILLKEEVILDIFNEKESETFPCLYFYISFSTLSFFNIGISFLLIRICKTNFSFQQQKIKSMRVTSPVLQLFIDLLLLLLLLIGTATFSSEVIQLVIDS